ncbi:MAG: thermonuclease family protein [Thermoleophilaceae bacterium]
MALAAGLALATSATWNEDRDRSRGGTGSGPPGLFVAEVVDGDTIELTNGQLVRLAQIDTPEVAEGECYSGEARLVLAALLPVGTEVRPRYDPRLDDVDRYGRLIRYVVKDGANLNLELVRRGAASVWFVDGDRGRHARGLLQAARRARRAGRGLWQACGNVRLDTSHGVRTGPDPTVG